MSRVTWKKVEDCLHDMPNAYGYFVGKFRGRPVLKDADGVIKAFTPGGALLVVRELQEGVVR